MEKNHGLCDKADKDYSLRVQIGNYDLWGLHVYTGLRHDS